MRRGFAGQLARRINLRAHTSVASNEGFALIRRVGCHVGDRGPYGQHGQGGILDGGRRGK